MKEDNMQLSANGYFASKLNKMDPLTATKHVSWQKVTQILGVDFEYTFSLVVKMTSL